MKKPVKRIIEVVIIIFIFVIIIAVALPPYNLRVFLGTHYLPEPGTSKQAVLQRMGKPIAITKIVPVPASKSNQEAIDSLKNLPVSYIMYWRRKPGTLEKLLDLRQRSYRTSVVAFDKHDKVIKGFWGYSYWPEQKI